MVMTRNDNRSAVVRVVIIEGINIPRSMPDNISGVFCSVQLGKQKVESCTVGDYKNPVWNKDFEFYIYDEDFREELLVTLKSSSPKSLKPNGEDIGNLKIDLSSIKPEVTKEFWKDLNRTSGVKIGKIHFLVTISGIVSNDSPSNSANIASWEMIKISLADKTNPFCFSSNDGFIGRLLVKIHKAEGLPAAKYLGAKPDPFCSVSICGDIFRTQTLYKTVSPSWNKCFEFNLNDINDCLQITVFDEEGDKKYRFLGALKIPLLQIHNEEKIWYLLKDKNLRAEANGDEPKIQLEFLIVYNTSMLQCQWLRPRYNFLIA